VQLAIRRHHREGIEAKRGCAQERSAVPTVPQRITANHIGANTNPRTDLRRPFVLSARNWKEQTRHKATFRSKRAAHSQSFILSMVPPNA
jgi:hypothetical protein